MKRMIFLLAIFFAAQINAQVVTTLPEYPTQYDSIVITFDATQGDGGLAGYTGDVYAHTGVITNLSTSDTDWRYVIGDWGNDSNQPKLTRIGTDLYQLVIGYPRTFYNVSNPSEEILKLAFVFRSAGASGPTGRDVGGADILVDLYPAGLTIVFNDPQINTSYGDPLRSPIFLNQDEGLPIEVSVAEIGVTLSVMKLYVNGVEQTETGQNLLDFVYFASSYLTGLNEVKVKAWDNLGDVDSSSFYVMTNPVPDNVPPPPGTKPGINYGSDPTQVTFELYAPHKEFVYLIGDFAGTDWKVGAEYIMHRYEPTSDSTLFWITLDNVSPGEEYSFQYFVDGKIRTADPYATEVLDGWNDQYISSQTYPNLKPYPEGKTSEYVSEFQTGQTPFPWNDGNYQRPDKSKLIIYELLIRDFIAEHSFQALKDTLNYLANLGVNAIELMPVNEFDGNISWGYNPAFYFAVDKYYGPAEKLKEFVEACHEKDIAVILDVVWNHSFGQSPFVRLYADGNYGPPSADNPWMNQQSPHPFGVGWDWNHESPDTRYVLDRANKYWMQEFHVDGYRYDLSKGFTQTYTGDDVNAWNQYDASRVYNIERMADALWSYDSNAIMILEHFTVNSEETELSNHGLLLWGNMNSPYGQASMGWLNDSQRSSDLNWGYYGNRGWTNANLVTYMESHDEDRIMWKDLEYGNNTNPNYIIRNNKELALQRQKLTAAFLFTFPGPKMLWQFGELGYDKPFPAGGRTDPQPILWNYNQDASRVKLYKVWQALIKMRNMYDVFNSPYTGVSMTVGQGIIGRTIHLNNADMNVTIVGNFGVNYEEVNPDFQHTGKWYDFFSGDSIQVTNTQERLNLAPSEFHIYTTQKLFTPEDGILTDVHDETESGIPYNFALMQNYPNPFNPTTIISYVIARSEATRQSVDLLVQLKVYDILGRKVATLVNKKQTPGKYSVKFDASNLSSGIYFYTLRAGEFTATKKMILMK